MDQVADVTRQSMAVTQSQDRTQFGTKFDTELGTGNTEVDAEFRRLSMRLGFDAPLGGRYLIERTAGIGAMGSVHVAFDKQLARRVALKQVRANPRSNPKRLAQRLEREAQTLARIDHRNVVGIYDVGQDHGEIFVAMEYIPGVKLTDWQSEQGRTTWEIIDAYIQAGRGLAAAHTCGVVHRDFKPDNVIFGDDGVVRVVDFGIAGALDPNGVDPTLESQDDEDEQTEYSIEQPSTAELERLTATGQIMGTVPYMSPEQLAGLPVDARSDQFSFCVALWEAVSGVRPFVGRSPGERLLSKAPPLGANDLPRWLRMLLARGLQWDPSARHRDMDALLAALEGRRRKLRSLGLTLLSGLALAGAVAVGSWLAEDPSEVESCSSFQADLNTHWDPARRTKLQAKLGALDPNTASFVIDELDRLAAQWTETASAACNGDVAPAIDSRTRECLTSYLQAFDRSVDAIDRAHLDSLARAPDLLTRLSPPGGDYCSISPNATVDPRVAHLARSARLAAVLGEFERADELADSALAAAQSVEHESDEFNLDMAEARVARGEAHAYAGDFESALTELAQAQRHAYGDHELSLEIALLRVKSLALSEGDVAVGQTLVEMFDPIADKLDLTDDDPRRAEIEEARGLLARAEKAYERAIAHHERAKAISMTEERLTDAAKSLLNIGMCRQDQGQAQLAEQAYTGALELFRVAGVPPRYRNRVETERNLGLLALERGDLKGLAHFEEVIRNGSRRSALEATRLAINLAYAQGDTSLQDTWAQRGLEALVANADGPTDILVDIRQVTGMILAERATDLDRGLELMDQAERDAASLDLETHAFVLRNRLLWSQRRSRCDELRAKLTEFAVLEAGPGATELGITQWREQFSLEVCPRENSTPNN